MTVSICIPTRNRPGYLLDCLASCLRQTRLPDEILIGDDSDDIATSDALSGYLKTRRPEIDIRYFRNSPSLGQARNVDRLFHEAHGDFLCLIHDDDLLLETALENLLSCVTKPEVIVAFGLQKVAEDSGTLDEEKSLFLNRCYFRSEEYEGVQESLLESALTSQLPNNGFLVTAACARATGYHDPDGAFGTGADFGFGVRLALMYPEGKAFFLHQPTAVYRESSDSIQRSGRSTAAFHAFAHLIAYPEEIQQRERVSMTLRRKAPVAVLQAATAGRWREGFSWYFGKWHRHLITTPGGVRRFLLLLMAMARSWRRPFDGEFPR